MRPHLLPLLLALTALPAASHAARPKLVHGVAAALLAQAARNTPVRAVDYDQERCDERTVEQWLRALTGPNARAIAWQGGPCELVGPGMDAGSRWCAQGVVTLAHPRSRSDKPIIEIFFDEPVHGRPGKAYAFRGTMEAADGLDLSRFRKDFEYDWTSRFKASEGAIVDCADE